MGERANPYLITGPALISFSGGRTSAFMLWNILQAHGGKLPDDVVDLRRTIHEIVEWVEMEVDLSLRPALRKRIEAAKSLLERPALSSPATPEPVSAPANGEVVNKVEGRS